MIGVAKTMYCFVKLPNSVVLDVDVDPKADAQECLHKVRFFPLIFPFPFTCHRLNERLFCAINIYFKYLNDSIEGCMILVAVAKITKWAFIYCFVPKSSWYICTEHSALVFTNNVGHVHYSTFLQLSWAETRKNTADLFVCCDICRTLRIVCHVVWAFLNVWIFWSFMWGLGLNVGTIDPPGTWSLKLLLIHLTSLQSAKYLLVQKSDQILIALCFVLLK